MDFIEIEPIIGLVAATFTPLLPNGDINLPLIPQYVNHLVANNIEYIFINGTTGEGASFTIEERKILAEKWIQAAKLKLKGVMVHVGAGNMHESIELASHAEVVGAMAVSAAPPTYFKPGSTMALVTYCKVVAEGSATLPFFFYHIPGLTGCQVPIHEFYEQASELIPNFRGIKYSSLDLVSLGWCLKIKRAYPTHQMFWGCDEALPCALDYGLQAAIGSTYNFMAPIHHLIIASQTKGEREKMMDWLFVVQDYIKSSKKHSKGGSLIPVLKVTMSFMSGLEMGPVRLPLETLSEAERSSLLKDFDKLCLGENIEKAKLLL